MLYQIEVRRQIEVNIDPENRCYNGCLFSPKLEWADWATFGRYSKEEGEAAIATFQAINPSREYRLVPIEGAAP